MPDIADLQNPISKYASQVYSVDGKILGTYSMNRENRVHVDLTIFRLILLKLLLQPRTKDIMIIQVLILLL